MCGFILKGQIPCPFWSTCLSEPLLESMAIAKPFFPGVSSRCSSTGQVPSEFHSVFLSPYLLALVLTWLSININTDLAGFISSLRRLWGAGGEDAGGSETSWTQAGRRQWTCIWNFKDSELETWTLEKVRWQCCALVWLDTRETPWWICTLEEVKLLCSGCCWLDSAGHIWTQSSQASDCAW